METIFEAPQQLPSTDPGPTLAELKRLGVDRVKLDVAWDYLAPDPGSRTAPAKFDAASPAAYPAAAWAPYDDTIRQAARDGIGVDLTLEGLPPLWASGRGAPPGKPHPQWEPSASDFGAFVAAVAKRYGGTYTPPGASAPLPRVDFWSIWNEPNYGPNLAPQAIDDSAVEVSPMFYRELLDAAWTALQQTGHGGDTILIGELAPRGETVGNQPGNFGGMVPLRFVRALYCVGQDLRPLQGQQALARGCPSNAAGSRQFAADNPALFKASGFAIHPYPQNQPPDVPTPNEPDYADLPQLPVVERTLDQIQQVYGSATRFPIYNTEFGFQTNPPEKIWRAISPATAAYYANWAEYISWKDPRVASFDQYLLTDPGPQSGSNFDTGLEFYDGQHKALYNAFVMPIFLPRTHAAKGTALEVWGCVRPSHYAALETKALQVAKIEFEPASGGPFKVLRQVTLTDPYGYFDVDVTFPSSGSVRIAWSYPHGSTVYSRTTEVAIG